MPNRYEIRHYPELDSTNSYLQKLALEGAAEGLVITTDFQTAGRGKPGRTWVSPKGKNLLFSILLRPKVAANKALIVTQITCQTVISVLKKYGIDAVPKRPNDVLVDGKKICGVLTEASTKENKIESVIVGIGLNVNAEQKELIPEATSMKILKNQEFSREEILNDFLAQFEKDLKGF